MWSELKKKVWWSKSSKLPCRIPGTHNKECDNSLVNKLNVNEEYKETFRTKSYIEIYSKVQDHLQGNKCMDTPSTSIPLYLHDLSQSILEPLQETLAHIIEGYNINLHPLLLDYFKINIEACNLCELLLLNIHQTRANYHIIKRVMKLTKRVPNGVNYSTNDQCNAIFQDLALFASIRNPLSTISPLEFRNAQNCRHVLFHRLRLQCKEIRRRIKLRKCIKKVVGCTIVVAYTALVVTLLALAFHTVVGIVTAPALLICSLGIFKKQNKPRKLQVQLDVAAKGVYILINDFNTMSRIMRRLNDEIEHSKAMADMCVRNNGKIEVLKEVVREFRIEESWFFEQLEELEEHIYLCFLTINRSRRLIVQELMHGACCYQKPDEL